MEDIRSIGTFDNLTLERQGCVFIITMMMGAENRLNIKFCQEMIQVFNTVREMLGPNSNGAVVTRGEGAKFFCTGLDLEETRRNPHANADGFYPLLHTILDFPFPTIALVNGHAFGGGCPLAFAHDYRVMNSKRGFISMPPVDLGMYFPGVGILPRLKLQPRVARKVLLEGHRFTGVEALEDGLVDAIAEPDRMLGVAMGLANKWAPKAKAGVYALLRSELWGEMDRGVQQISYVHSRPTFLPGKAKI
ncbi:carnitinyl-CoA dehydratase [Aspergillus bombycis]|uniref:Carnitinyl-CoA dehydratase n=1 Tax=Aspergillus bombycis TaxID=109264 RepID=A0A1F7ZK18_9EURO|nr:carnitinyl-CoA dehydratase [Aspergillus bombycis]OGM39649.1 carnitinyl-CoA dehydratase [Aspergillus bombycis]